MAIFHYPYCNALAVPVDAMTAMTLQATTPWSITQEEDRRFRWILLQTLAASLIIGVITPYLRLPQPEADIEQPLPPRRVHLLTEQESPAPMPAPSPAATLEPTAALETTPPVVPAPSRPPNAVTPSQTAPVATPRETAASSGVLAMGSALKELQSHIPRTGTTPGRGSTVTTTAEAPSTASTLGANVTRGSGGIEGGVAHQSVLGAPGLPERRAGRAGDGFAGSDNGTVATTTASRGGGRSQEQIQELLDRNKGAMYTLYNRELRKDASLQGKLVMSITIAPAGHVTRCVILSSELDSAVLEQQLVALVSGLDFGDKPEASAVTTKIPIEFFPQ